MPRLLIESQFSDNLELDAAGARAMGEINGEIGVDWLYSFLSADRKKTYCLYERADAEGVRQAARRNNLPADALIGVADTIRPEVFLA